MPSKLRVLGFAGSLRQGSYNRALLQAAVELAPSSMEITTFDIAPIPLYNQDVEDRGFPEPVKKFKQAIAEADALLICTPEYNFSIPGVLKNALDWASRPAKATPLSGKPVSVMGASTGSFGTARSQLALRSVFMFCNMRPVNTPQVLVTHAAEKFDKNGRLTDEPTKENIRENLTQLVTLTLILQKGKAALQR